MIAISCTHEKRCKIGKDRKGNQRYRCTSCRKTFSDNSNRPLGDMRIDLDKAAMAISMLIEGMSVRSTERITGLHRDTVCNLIIQVGNNCERFIKGFKDIHVDDVQADEIWSFVGCKDRTKAIKNHSEEMGDSWTFIAIERNTKLVLAYEVGKRDFPTCDRFLAQLDKATAGRFQMTTDGLTVYKHNVPFKIGSRVDFGQLVKTYASSQTETRYSPAKIIRAEKVARFGQPDPDRICTSHVERLNLTLRMNMRRFTRLTNGFSKTLDHHRAMQGIFFCWYNMVRVHETIKTTPAIQAGIATNRWTIKEMIQKVAN